MGRATRRHSRWCVWGVERRVLFFPSSVHRGRGSRGLPQSVRWPRLVAERWTGKRWSLQRMPIPPGGEGYDNVSMRRCVLPVARHLRCGGLGHRSPPCSCAQTTSAVIEVWNGRKWRVASAGLLRSASDTWLDRVACSSASSCLAVGGYDFGSGCDYDGPCTTKPLVARWTKGRWTVDQAPRPGSGKGVTLAGVSCAGHVCIVVGSFPRGAHRALFAAQAAGGGWAIASIPQAPA